MSPRRREVLLLLRALGQAKAFEITLLTGFRRKKTGGTGTANIIQGLTEAGYIEKVPRTPEAQPYYRLSAFGRKRIEGVVGKAGMPPPIEIRESSQTRTRLLSSGAKPNG
jgi:hypothetical protein